jgi:4-hydroxy-3-polyprenylbenzoate decarboxylase
MAFDSYRDFVNALDRAGELKRISEPVATELEITEIADREMKSPNGGKALLFEKPTVNGQVSPFPVAINTMGSHKRMAMSMGAESVDDVANELGATVVLADQHGFQMPRDRLEVRLASLGEVDERNGQPPAVRVLQ